MMQAPVILLAGMPMPTLTEVAGARVDAISFFVVVYLTSAAIFKWLWNLLAKDFPWMPKLSFGKSVALLLVVGVFMYFILTMISGARELMTPGAWAKEGSLYRVRPPEQEPKPWVDAGRVRWFQLLRSELWKYASSHDGKLPANQFVRDFDSGLWKGLNPDEGQWLGYCPGLLLTGPPKILVYEPSSYGASRWVLLTDGTVQQMETNALSARLKKEWEP